jgi:beta-galactosidase GanA
MWPRLLKHAKKAGIDAISTYVLWDVHEEQPGSYNFSGSRNISQFLSAAATAGLFVNLRIGPFVCAEWNYGR